MNAKMKIVATGTDAQLKAFLPQAKRIAEENGVLFETSSELQKISERTRECPL
jgi:hypothetical protein